MQKLIPPGFSTGTPPGPGVYYVILRSCPTVFVAQVSRSVSGGGDLLVFLTGLPGATEIGSVVAYRLIEESQPRR